MTPGAQLILPKRARPSLSCAAFEELRAEFGHAPGAQDDAPSATPRQTCPFCHASIERPSRVLRDMLSFWEQRKKAGHVLRPTDTLAVCEQHRNERDVIPHGASRGWPMSIDFRQLRRRITSPDARYLRILHDCIEHPDHSVWFRTAKAQRAAQGRKVCDLNTFDERLCGYYGERGWELLHEILYAVYVQDPLLPTLDLTRDDVQRHFAPLNTSQFLDNVLLPELVCLLIQDDLGGAPYDEAMRVQRESQKFGMAMYASDAPPPKRMRLVQQTLPVRRTSRPTTPATYHEASSDEERPVWHQQRLFLPPRR